MFSIIQAAGWPIWPLLICSVVALALVLERIYSLADKRIVPKDLLDEAIKASRLQLPSEESVKHLASHSLLGRVLASGLQQLRQQPQSSETELSESIEIAGKQAAHDLEKYLVVLATIASAAPSSCASTPSAIRPPCPTCFTRWVIAAMSSIVRMRAR